MKVRDMTSSLETKYGLAEETTPVKKTSVTLNEAIDFDYEISNKGYTKEDIAYIRELINNQKSLKAEEEDSNGYDEELEPQGEGSEIITEEELDEDFSQYAFSDDVCCLCGEPIEGYGNNPYPLDDTPGAKCCDICNMDVIKARMDAMRGYAPKLDESVKPRPAYSYEGHIQDAVDHYRKLAGLSGEEELTEDMLRKPYIEATCCRKSVTPDELKNALLKR